LRHRENLANPRQQRAKVGNAIRLGVEHDHDHPGRGDILLELEVAVDGNQDAKAAFPHARQEPPVPPALPAKVSDVRNVKSMQVACETPRCALVEQDAHVIAA
jgi:hypothetical protein